MKVNFYAVGGQPVNRRRGMVSQLPKAKVLGMVPVALDSDFALLSPESFSGVLTTTAPPRKATAAFLMFIAAL